MWKNELEQRWENNTSDVTLKTWETSLPNLPFLLLQFSHKMVQDRTGASSTGGQLLTL